MHEREQKGGHMAEDIEVTIFGQTFRIAAGSAEPEYIQRLATYVDERMRTIAHAASAASLHRVAVLAALNIADDLLKLQEQHSHASETMTAKTEQLIDLVAQRAILMARVRAFAAAGQIDPAREIMATLTRLPGATEFELGISRAS